MTAWPTPSASNSKLKQFNHVIDVKLYAYCSKINQYAFVAFALIICINIVYFLLYGFALRRWLIFPITEYFVFDVHNDWLSSIMYTINWLLLLSVIVTQVRLQEMHINIASILRAVAMFFCLNLFGTIQSILIMYPIVTVLNYTYYYKFKSRLRFFLNNCMLCIDPQSDENDKFLRLIAVNHLLSKLCYKLQTYSLRKKNQSVNNTTVYHKLHQKLDRKLSSLRALQTPSSKPCTNAPSSEHYNELRAKQVYAAEIESVMETQRFWHRWTFRLYALCINLSMIRCLFFSDGLDLYHNHFIVYNVFWLKIAFEIMAALALLTWCYFDENIQKIKQSDGLFTTRFYYIVLKSPEFKCIDQIIYDHLLMEADRFYETWKYALHGPVTREILKKYVGKDLAGTICQHLFEIDINNKNYNHSDSCVHTADLCELDIDEEFWNKMTAKLDQNN
eukprot:CAMPEP_0197032210 /NCGR_PEP_ID=MMETSP1384-20130603/10944_1 /TAXON_ID=29189 /ORGANISM="Ammonia sp." /LENGTH=446 /DNA_ID=CAMNT_0042461837 /DNA_START=23 /DNA_END=1363 /DNA_ORIENTATION=-